MTSLLATKLLLLIDWSGPLLVFERLVHKWNDVTPSIIELTAVQLNVFAGCEVYGYSKVWPPLASNFLALLVSEIVKIEGVWNDKYSSINRMMSLCHSLNTLLCSTIVLLVVKFTGTTNPRIMCFPLGVIHKLHWKIFAFFWPP